MFEHRKQPLLSKRKFFNRLLFSILSAVLIIASALFIGIFGYHYFEDFGWIDSLLNASMILGGMGPVDILKTDGGKLFASFYALFSGTIFLVSIGIIMAPIFHRFLHHFHFEDRNSK